MSEVTLVPLDLEEHTALVHLWMGQPHARPWWDLARPIHRVREYLEEQLARPHLTPWVAAANGAPFAYVETYRAAEDPLAEHYPARPGDRGWHVMVGPERLLGSGIPRRMGHVVIGHLFAVEGAERVVCEPDERNARMIAFCQRLGGRVEATLDLPDKRAVLLVWDRPPADPAGGPA